MGTAMEEACDDLHGQVAQYVVTCATKQACDRGSVGTQAQQAKQIEGKAPMLCGSSLEPRSLCKTSLFATMAAFFLVTSGKSTS